MNRFNRSLVITLIAAMCALVVPAMASAHEHRDVADGRYSLVVGFSTEPAYTGFLNGLDQRVSDNSLATPSADGEEPAGAPVDGLEETLQAEIIYGDQTMPLTIEPRWQTPGAYDAWVVPTAAGDYTFHIFGTIGDTPIDETFTSSPEGFGSVADQSTIQFPKASASNSAPVFGTVSGGGGFDWTVAGGAAAGFAAGAAGLFLIQRRIRHGSTPRLAASRVGAGD
jgi:hypothetical protein